MTNAKNVIKDAKDVNDKGIYQNTFLCFTLHLRIGYYCYKKSSLARHFVPVPLQAKSAGLLGRFIPSVFVLLAFSVALLPWAVALDGWMDG